MAVCTSTEIFDFMGVETAVREKYTKFIEFLITNVAEEIENTLGRKLEKLEFSDVILKNNINCYFFKDKIYLTKKYRDIYKITNLQINNVEISDFELDKYSGCIFLNNMNLNDAIKISGHLGLVNEQEITLSELKLLCMELISVKSKLWTRNIYTLNGTVETLVLDISEDSKNIINKYCLKEF